MARHGIWSLTGRRSVGVHIALKLFYFLVRFTPGFLIGGFAFGNPVAKQRERCLCLLVQNRTRIAVRFVFALCQFDEAEFAVGMLLWNMARVLAAFLRE